MRLRSLVNQSPKKVSTMEGALTIPEEIFTAYDLQPAAVAPIKGGNINRTYVVKTQGAATPYILQWVNPIFPPAIHLDMAVITEHLQAQNFLTSKLLKNKAGELYTVDHLGQIWRLLTYIPGVVYETAPNTAICYEAGKLVGKFHHALTGFKPKLQAKRVMAHDTPRYMQHLREVLAAKKPHIAYNEVRALAEQLFNYYERVPALSKLPQRLVHGDLKLSNLIFAPEGAGLAIIDLDTFNYLNLPIELGDALRSWCNPLGEEALESELSLEFLEAALKGFQEAIGKLLTPVESEYLGAGLITIILELSSRFAADALEETYFGWNQQIYAAAWQHHLRRAKSQLHLATSYFAKESDVQKLLAKILVR